MGNDNSSTTGWRVLSADHRGPCSNCNIIPYFDYILEINGKMLDQTATGLKEALESNRNKQTELTIFNYKTKKARKVEVCPCDNWGGVGILGLRITSDSWATADERMIRVMSVFPKSPAEAAGLHPFVDYIMGSDTHIFQGLDSFEAFVVRHIDTEIELKVYNSNNYQVREVRVTPTANWSQMTDQGILGCEGSSGLLHKCPEVFPDTVITIHETLMSTLCDVSCGVVSPAKEEGARVCSTGIKSPVKEISEKASLVPKQPSVPLSCKDPIELFLIERGALKSSKYPDLLSSTHKVQPSAKVPGLSVELCSTKIVRPASEVMESTKAKLPANGITSVPTEKDREVIHNASVYTPSDLKSI